jgi:hypothetical protein
MSVAHTCNPSYLGGCDQDCGSKPALENSSEDPHLQNNQSKMESVAQVVGCLLCKREALSSNSKNTKKNFSGVCLLL